MLSACGSKSSVISVGSKNTTEQLILGEILAAHLEKQLPGVRIARKLGLGAASVVQSAMMSGELDLYVEDIGTMIGTVLKEDVPPEEAIGLERARAQYQSLFKLSVLRPLGFHRRFVVMRSATAGSVAAKFDTLSALADSGKGVRLGVVPDYADRKDTVMALTTKYRISLLDSPKQLETATLYDALSKHTVDLAAGTVSDSWVGEPEFAVVKDDRTMFPAYANCILVTNRALGSIAELQRVLESLSGRIKDEAVHKMKKDVDLKHRTAAEVAKEFLTAAGL